MHRELSHITRLAAPLQLQGKTVIKSPTVKSTNGRWDKLMEKTKDRVKSPDAVIKRRTDNENAKRTINPELNNEQVKNTTRKISSRQGPENPGSILNLFKKSGTNESVKVGDKKHFKNKQKTEDLSTPKQVKRISKPLDLMQDVYCSHIPTLPSPTYREERVRDVSIPKSPRCDTESGQRKQDQLKSAISFLPGGPDTKRTYQDIDERKNLKSANAPRMAQHLASTLNSGPTFYIPIKRNPNKQNYISYEDSGRLHPYSKGKKVAYPEYTERNTSTILSPGRDRTTNPLYTSRTGGMEPLDMHHVGRRGISRQPIQNNNIVNPPDSKGTQRGSTAFSFRTFASQITF